MKKGVYIYVIYFFISLNCAHAENLIKITEIFPNPKGRDTYEWIELFNPQDKTISIKDWRLEINQKKYQIKKDLIIEPKQKILLEKKEYKFSLNNTKCEIKLYNNQDALIDQVSYENSKEGLSYSYVKIFSKEAMSHANLWTNPTPFEKNPIFYEISGKIKIPPTIGNDYYFILDNKKIIIDKNTHNFEILKNLLTKNTKITILLREDNVMERFKINSIPKQIQNKKNKFAKTGYYFLIPVTILLLILIKLSHNQKTMAL